ncbi:MAG: glycosyltransferase family 87 protein [Chloroherpetonaceae bacterium]|nr:glycosyltransferase family 87 protein [Chloroherpetonaceae bacterium]
MTAVKSSFKAKALQLLLFPQWLIIAMVLLCTLAAAQKVMLGDINNYLIFKTSFEHLLAGKDLYLLHPEDHFDYYKYSPLFALLMAPFSLLPVALGASLWGALNAALPLWALHRLGNDYDIETKKRSLLMLVLFLELLTSVQNMQSNGILLGMMIWGGFEIGLTREKQAASPGFISGTGILVLAAFIKPFAAAMGVIAILSRRLGGAVITGIIFFVGLFLLPLVILPWESLLTQYASWLNLLRWDNQESSGISFIGLMKTAFGFELNNTVVQAIAALILVIPFIYLLFVLQKETQQGKDNEKSENTLVEKNGEWLREFQLLSIASVLVWVVIFNHKAESPTFVIALAGIYLYALWSKMGVHDSLKKILIWGTFIMSTLSSTDLFPEPLRVFWKENNLKVVPCLIGWVFIEWARYKTLLKLTSEANT